MTVIGTGQRRKFYNLRNRKKWEFWCGSQRFVMGIERVGGGVVRGRWGQVQFALTPSLQVLYGPKVCCSPLILNELWTFYDGRLGGLKWGEVDVSISRVRPLTMTEYNSATISQHINVMVYRDKLIRLSRSTHVEGNSFCGYVSVCAFRFYPKYN